MTYEAQSLIVGRIPICIVEIDLDYCENTYGTAPCTASGSGDAKCFNCFKTCQDTANYSKTTKTYKFCSSQAYLPIGDTYFPCVRDVDIAPTQLKIIGLSVDCSVTVSLQDFTHHDRGIDPYVGERTYNPEEQGTFFGRLCARNPYVQNREMRIKEGYIDENRTLHLQTRTYLIDRIERPDSKGVVKIYGKGLLRSISEGKQKGPAYLATLDSGIGTGAATLNLTFEATRGDLLGPTGYVKIGDELMFYASRAGNALTVNSGARGGYGTPITSHAAGARVFQAKVYTGVSASNKLTEIMRYLLVDCGLVPSGYVDVSEWDAEVAAKYDDPDNGLTNNRVLTLSKPKPVKDLVEEILRTMGAAMWYDEFQNKLIFRVFDGVEDDVPVWDDSIILSGTLSWKILEKEYFSQIGFYHMYYLDLLEEGKGDIDPTPDNTDISYYYVDTDAESENRHNNSVTYDIPTRFVTITSVFDEVAERLLAIFSSLRREIKLRVDARHATRKIGDYVDISTRHIQGFDGAPLTVRCVVTEMTPRYSERGSHFDYKLVQIVRDPDGE